jgi:hypothetical protein
LFYALQSETFVSENPEDIQKLKICQGDEKGLEFPHQGKKPNRCHPGERGCVASVMSYGFSPLYQRGAGGILVLSYISYRNPYRSFKIPLDPPSKKGEAKLSPTGSTEMFLNCDTISKAGVHVFCYKVT